MTPASNKPTRVAVQGFSPSERSTFESFFGLAAQRTPAYLPEADPARAHFIVVDADDVAICTSLAERGLMHRALALGATKQPDALIQLPRPVNLMLVVRALDKLPRAVAQPRTPSGASPQAMGGGLSSATSKGNGQVQRVLDDLAQRAKTLSEVAHAAATMRQGVASVAATRAEKTSSGAQTTAQTGEPKRTEEASQAQAKGSQPPVPQKVPQKVRLRGSVLADEASGFAPRAESRLVSGLNNKAGPGQQGQALSNKTEELAGGVATLAEPDLDLNLEQLQPKGREADPTLQAALDGKALPVWADARGIAASLAAQAAAQAPLAWPSLEAQKASSAALWLPDLSEPASTNPTVAAPWPTSRPSTGDAAAQAAPPASSQDVDIPIDFGEAMPAPAPVAAALPNFSSSSSASAAAAPVDASSALLVDESDLARRATATVLGRHGLKVQTAKDATEAQVLMSKQSFGLLFVEINLEADSDFPITQWVREQVSLHGTQAAPRLVLLADRHSPGELQAAAQAGAHACLATPILDAELQALLPNRRP